MFSMNNIINSVYGKKSLDNIYVLILLVFVEKYVAIILQSKLSLPQFLCTALL